MSAGSEIALEIASGLAEAGEETGDGSLVATFRVTGVGPTSPHDTTPSAVPTYFQLTCLDGTTKVRDASGVLTGQITRTLTVAATGDTPKKSHTVAVGVKVSDVVEGTTLFSEISEVRTEAPGGVPLLYEVDLVR